jgi:hypothetical protein
MKIVQKTLLGKCTTFELTESAVRVSVKGILSNIDYEISLANLKQPRSYSRRFSGGMLAAAIFFYMFTAAMLIGLINPIKGAGRDGFALLSLIGLVVAMRLTAGFLRSKKDLVIWYSTLSHARALMVHRRLPTEIQASEFADAIDERLNGLARMRISPNQAAEPTSTAVTPPADAGDRASGARGSP